MSNPSNIILHDFKRIQRLWKMKVKNGECTKEEAMWAILTAAEVILLNLKVPTLEEENMYQGSNYE